MTKHRSQPSSAAAAAGVPGSAAGFKSRGGLARIWRAGGYTWAGLRAAFRHEAAFRQELAVGVPLIAFAWWAAPGRWQALALTASVLLVWLVEMLNSAIEMLADAVSADAHPLLGRAKDLGSAAVGFALALALLTWGVVFWP
jgi:diacylglycerol kinase (ATP)